MKKVFFIAAILLLFINLKAQTPAKKQFPVGEKCASVMNELKDLHEKTLKFFNEKNFDEAYPLAKKMSEIAEANCLDEKDKRLTLALNVADIQIKRGKTGEAQEIFDKNLALAEDVYGTGSTDFDNYIKSLLKLSVNNVSTERYEQYALKSLEAKKSRFGTESYETAHELLRMAAFYRAWKKFEKAEPYYLEAIAVSDKFSADEKMQKLAAVNKYRSYLLERYGEKEGVKKADEFMQKRFQELPAGDEKRNILNGRAVKLVRPEYPLNASNVWARGEVKVEVTIDENGKVIKAKAITGHPFLRQPAEFAAKDSRFLTTYIDGKPVKVTGVIVYKF